MTIQIGNPGTAATAQQLAQLRSDLGVVSGAGNVLPLAFWKQARNQVMTNSGRARLWVFGDSRNVGAYGQSAGTFVDTRQYSTANLLAQRLAAASLPAEANSTFGDNNTAPGGTALPYDPPVIFGTGWQFNGSGPTAYSLSGNFTFNQGGTAPYGINARNSFNTVDVYWLTAAGAFDLQVGGIKVGSTVVTAGSVASLNKTTFVVGALNAAGTPITVVRADGGTGNIFLCGIHAYLTTAAKVDVFNGAISGATVSTFLNSAAPYNIGSAIPTFARPDLSVIDLTVNDTGVPTPLKTYESLQQSLISSCQQTGDVILATGNPINTANGRLYQSAMVDILGNLAAKNNCRLADTYKFFGSYEQMVANGYIAPTEQIHPLRAGLQAIADLIYAQIPLA